MKTNCAARYYRRHSLRVLDNEAVSAPAPGGWRKYKGEVGIIATTLSHMQRQCPFSTHSGHYRSASAGTGMYLSRGELAYSGIATTARLMP